VQTDKKWMTISEAARHIGMSTGFLRKAVRLQRVPHTRIGTKALRFDREALDTWLTAQGCGGEVNYAGRAH
jgi:excisionase family DNA binding protein